MRDSGRVTRGVCGLALLLAGCAAVSHAEDGSAAWLRYAPPANADAYKVLPARILYAPEGQGADPARDELQKGLAALLVREFHAEGIALNKGKLSLPGRLALNKGNPALEGDALVIGTPEALTKTVLAKEMPAGASLAKEEYRITLQKGEKRSLFFILGGSRPAEFYGVFHLLELIAANQPLPTDERSAPAAPIRWTDEWDNLNGTIERGYAGPSIFFENGHVKQDLSRAGRYARLLSSVGINGCNINNVNADLDLLTSEHLQEFARVADAFRPWGVKLALSIDLTSPQTVGHLTTFDPLDPTVIAWWKSKIDEIYKLIPDFGGFTVKADSESRKGPSQYGRSPADAANVLARALQPHGGVVLYRGFVYNNHLDPKDLKADRARAGVDNFVKYDGQFEPNVLIQIKEGPIDFQTREPVSPLFAALPHSNVAIEVQTSQEYTGQQRHMVWLPSMWKWVLDTDLRAGGKSTPVKEIVEGRAFPQPDGKPRLGGFISVTNVGMEANWLHHPMALANLYGFGKLAWNPDAPLDQIIDTWTRLTWGSDPQVTSVIDALELKSWSVYEGYTGPNGMGTVTHTPGFHFGPGVESGERSGSGMWFRGEKDGIGMNRTAAGTGYAQQYPQELAAKYESLATCPDDLLLFFHHVPYNYKLRSGKTLVQSIYDGHYASALAAAEYVPQWMTLKGKVDDERYEQVLRLFNYQAGHALVWRDAINNWFVRISGIEDEQGRVGHDPNRIEAEAMQATGYEPVDVTPWETASGGKAVMCHVADGCTLSTTLNRPAGQYDVAVQYFDMWRGVSQYELLVNGTSVGHWAGDDTLPPAQFDPHSDGNTSTRFTVHAVALKPGDTLMLRGMPDLRPELNMPPAPPMPGTIDPSASNPHDFREYAPVDYIEIGPNGPVTPQ